MNLYEITKKYLDNNKKGVIATVVTKEGSAPRNVRTKMFVGEDGKTYGTVGGGSLEFKVYNEAMTHMESKPRIVNLKMDSEEVLDKSMICGGNVDVFMEPLLKRYEDVYDHLKHMEKTGTPGVIITQFNNEKFLKTVIEKSDDIFDFKANLKTFGSKINEEDKEMFLEHLQGLDLYINDGALVEVFNPSPTLYIFGAGHISQFIARIAKMVGFHVVVIDDRAEFANKKRFPNADEILVEPIPDVFNILKFTGKEFVTIVTRGHQFDMDVLKETLKRDTKYVGMIGSCQKVKLVFEYMKKCGFSDDTLSRVHSPIGLPINAETPQEIAVSILAEIITVRRENKKTKTSCHNHK